MKLLIYMIIILQIYTVSANANTTSNKIQNSIPLKVEQSNIQPVKEDVGSLTLAVNVINNIMTWTSVLVGVITLLVGAFGYFGYNRMENQIKNKIAEIDKKRTDFDDCILQMKGIQAKLVAQEKYTCNSNIYIYDTLDKIANQIAEAEKGKVILEKMLHSYQITNLYAAENDLKFAALAYIQNNGTLDDIKHLEHVATYDAYEQNRVWAREIIGIIKHKQSA